MTFEVPDLARRYLCRLDPEAPHTQRYRLTRNALKKHLQNYVASLSEFYRSTHDRELTASELRDASAAVQWLKGLGKSDGEIRAWLLMQRARLHFHGEQLDVR
jgi:hypothetical protein